MSVLAPAALWPPHVGDYARVRTIGVLGEVIGIVHTRDGCQYTVNLFEPDADAPQVYRPEDLEPVWDRWAPGDAVAPAPHLHGQGRILEVLCEEGDSLTGTLGHLGERFGLPPQVVRACLDDMARAGWIAIESWPFGCLNIRIDRDPHRMHPLMLRPVLESA